MSENAAQVALVTGATSGIGGATAVALGRAGFTVLVDGRNVERGVQTVKEIEHAGGSARFIAADLDDSDQVMALAERAGEVDVLVNNGGRSWFGPAAELNTATFDTLFAGNVRTAHQLVGALAPGMARRQTVGIDRIIEQAGVAKATLYNTFGSKEKLVEAYLQARHAATMAGPIQRAADDYRTDIRSLFGRLAAEIEVPDPDTLARQLQLIYDGAGLAARMDRDPSIAIAARAAAESLLDAACGNRRLS